MPPEGKPRQLMPGESLTSMSPRVREHAAKAGVADRMKRPYWRSNTSKAHQLTELAKAHGKGGQMRDALFAAYWEQGKDIGLDEVLRDIVVAVGLDRAEAASAMADQRYLPDVMAQFDERHQRGFESIPGYLIGEVQINGVLVIDDYRAAAQRATADDAAR